MPTTVPPKREARPAVPCVAIRSDVTMAQLGTDLPPLHDELARWLTARGLSPAGPPFWRYVYIDMARKLTVDVGFPVANPVQGDTRVRADTLPAGTYVTTTWRGHPDELEGATGELLAWAAANGVTWDKQPDGPGEVWRSRIEWYLSAPDVPMDLWDTELAFLTR